MLKIPQMLKIKLRKAPSLYWRHTAEYLVLLDIGLHHFPLRSLGALTSAATSAYSSLSCTLASTSSISTPVKHSLYLQFYAPSTLHLQFRFGTDVHAICIVLRFLTPCNLFLANTHVSEEYTTSKLHVIRTMTQLTVSLGVCHFEAELATRRIAEISIIIVYTVQLYLYVIN